jgi:hypothetical protein
LKDKRKVGWSKKTMGCNKNVCQFYTPFFFFFFGTITIGAQIPMGRKKEKVKKETPCPSPQKKVR